MPRKRSASGRAKISTIENRIRVQTEKVNKKFRSLEKSDYYGHYKSKELLTFIAENPNLKVVRGKGSKRHKVVYKSVKGTTMGRLILVTKKLKSFLRSKGSTVVGIEKIKAKTLKTITAKLTGIKGSDVSNRDLEIFYDIIKHRSDEILNKIDPSEFYALVSEARENNYGEEKWISMINDYVEINNKELREACKYLYEKYVLA